MFEDEGEGGREEVREVREVRERSPCYPRTPVGMSRDPGRAEERLNDLYLLLVAHVGYFLL